MAAGKYMLGCALGCRHGIVDVNVDVVAAGFYRQWFCHDVSGCGRLGVGGCIDLTLSRQRRLNDGVLYCGFIQRL